MTVLRPCGQQIADAHTTLPFFAATRTRSTGYGRGPIVGIATRHLGVDIALPLGFRLRQ